VVPVVDLRRRFEVSSMEPNARQRILVLAFAGGKTGFMVDSVSEVLRISGDAISPAPDVSSAQPQLIDRVANLDAQGRIVLLIDPTKLLDRVESDVLAQFDPGQFDPALKAS
jgi:purine-binding chemotaxis protein CheW